MRLVAKILGIAATLCIIAVASIWHIGHRPIAHHNSTLDDLIESATQVELLLVPRYEAGGMPPDSKQAHVITDRKEIEQLLSCLKLPWHLRASGKFHKCDGHLVVVITMPNSKVYEIPYDHGKSIYPISASDDSAGFCNLSPEARDKLNKLLFAKGYSSSDLGMPE